MLNILPRPIRTAGAHAAALRQFEPLVGKPNKSAAESDLLDLLVLLIEAYEAERWPTPQVSPAEMLEHCLESRGITASQLSQEIGVSKSLLSNVLAGRRDVSKSTALKLSGYFQTPVELFLNAPSS